MSRFSSKTQRASVFVSTNISAKLAAQASQKVVDKDALVCRFLDIKSESAGNSIQVNIRISRQNRTTEPTSAVFWLWFATTRDGAAGGTQTVDPPDAGTIIETVSADEFYTVMSDSDGVYQFALTKPTAGSVFVRAQIGTQVTTQEYVWT